jgi:hypothetical protein
MKLRQLHINAPDARDFDRSRMTFDARWACDSYRDLIGGKLDAGKYTGIQIELRRSGLSPSAKGFDRWLQVELDFDLRSYFKQPLGARKVILNDVLRDGCIAASSALGIDPAHFERCHQAVAAAGYLRSWTCPRVRSKDGKRAAALECIHDIDEFRMNLLVMTADGQLIERVHVISSKPDSLIFTSHIGKPRWKSSRMIDVLNAAGITFFTADVYAGQITYATPYE